MIPADHFMPIASKRPAGRYVERGRNSRTAPHRTNYSPALASPWRTAQSAAAIPMVAVIATAEP